MCPLPLGRSGWVWFWTSQLRGLEIFSSANCFLVGVSSAVRSLVGVSTVSLPAAPFLQGHEECMCRDSALAQLKEMFPGEDDDYLRDVLGSRKHDVPAAMQVPPRTSWVRHSTFSMD